MFLDLMLKEIVKSLQNKYQTQSASDPHLQTVHL